jgi:Rieske Fe-S protein
MISAAAVRGRDAKQSIRDNIGMMKVMQAGKTYTFDSFECVIHACAPECEHYGCRVIGHGVEKSGLIFCCASFAGMEGVRDLRDRAA